MATSQHYSLRWNNYLRHITFAFDSLRTQDEFVDVTLCCDGQKIKAHKMLLSACSGYFKEIFKENPHPHPVIIFKFIKFEDLNAIIEFMYQGEVNVQQDGLQSFLQTAELLAVQGLTSEEKEKPKTQKCSSVVTASPIILPVEEQNVKNSSPMNNVDQNSQNPFIELQTNITSIIKKRKILYSDEQEQIYTEPVEFSKEDQSLVKNVQFLPATTVKMDIPEYLNEQDANEITETSSTSSPDKKVQSHETTTQTSNNFTSEYEILAESEVEEKYQPRSSSDIPDLSAVQIDATEVGFKCSICWKGFKHPMSLTLHKDLHSGKTKCPVCKRNFSRSYDMRTHLNKIHKIILNVDAKLN